MSDVQLAEGSFFASDYRIVRPLSSGGMGAVYVVVQESTGAERALKLMHPQLVANPALRKRFEQEARIGGRIESDHVVQVLAAGVDATSGVPYLVMELLRGQDLAGFVAEQGAASPALTLSIIGQLCHALAAAHDVGIVHRDLKPENIFLAKAKRAEVPFTVKILDFGIAKMVAETKTAATDAIGSPMWMAPEQSSKGSSVGPETDVWALGLIAYFLLTGKNYWVSASLEDSNMLTLLREMLMDPLEPASGRASSLGARMPPPGFDTWFSRCVVRERGARFPAARDAHQALIAAIGAPSSANAPLVGADAPSTDGVRAIGTSLPRESVSATHVAAPLWTSGTPAPASRTVGGPPSVEPRRSKTNVVWIVGALAAVAVATIATIAVFTRPGSNGTDASGEPRADEHRAASTSAPQSSTPSLTTPSVTPDPRAPTATTSADHGTASASPRPPNLPLAVPTVTPSPPVTATEPTPTPTAQKAPDPVADPQGAQAALKAKVFGGGGSPNDIKVLRSLCRQSGDQSCVARCNDLLK